MTRTRLPTFGACSASSSATSGDDDDTSLVRETWRAVRRREARGSGPRPRPAVEAGQGRRRRKRTEEVEVEGGAMVAVVVAIAAIGMWSVRGGAGSNRWWARGRERCRIGAGWKGKPQEC